MHLALKYPEEDRDSYKYECCIDAVKQHFSSDGNDNEISWCGFRGKTFDSNLFFVNCNNKKITLCDFQIDSQINIGNIQKVNELVLNNINGTQLKIDRTLVHGMKDEYGCELELNEVYMQSIDIGSNESFSSTKINNCESNSFKFRTNSISNKMFFFEGKHNGFDISNVSNLEIKLIEIGKFKALLSKLQLKSLILDGVTVTGELTLKGSDSDSKVNIINEGIYNKITDHSESLITINKTTITELNFSSSREMVSDKEIRLFDVEVENLAFLGGNKQKEYECKKFDYINGRVGNFEIKNLDFYGLVSFENVKGINKLLVKGSKFFDSFKVIGCNVKKANFSGSEFMELIDLSDSEFEEAPNCYKSDFETNFRMSSKTKFNDSSEGAVERYTTLRKLMTSAKQLSYAGEFHRLELRSMSKKNWWSCFCYKVYEYSSRCCQSIGLPIFWLIVVNLLFGFSYCVSSESCSAFSVNSEVNFEMINFTLKQIFKPFYIWNEALGNKEFNGFKGVFLGLVPIIATLQSAVSLSLIALMFFAIRRKYKMPG